MKMVDLARIVTNPPGRTVVDKTGLSGDSNFTVEWTPDANENMTPKGPSIFTVLREQPGLRVESQEGSVEMFVVDGAETPSAN